MAKLYISKGNCSLESNENIAGIEIRYKGAVKITKTCSDGCLLVAKNNGIIIVSLDGSSLTDLFTYDGEFKITSIIVSDINAQPVPTNYYYLTDYSEMISSKSEDITIDSEKLNAGYSHGAKRKETTIDIKIMKNQKSDGTLYLKDGTPYSSGSLYHIHLNSGQAMTGGEHTDESENLYILKEDGKVTDNKIIRIKDPSIKRKPITRKTTSGGTGGGGY